jgi:hypothetical protein
MAMFSLATVMLIAQPQAYAVTCPTLNSTDFDLDGYTDQQECEGLALMDSSPVPGAMSGALRTERLDPNSKDLFVIWAPAIPSNIPAFPLEFINASTAAGGLGLVTHVITPAQAPSTRYINATQKAIRITENLDPGTSDTLGVANYGTPNDLDFATIYTARITEHVNSVCSQASSNLNCKDIDGVTIGAEALIDKYIKHTIAHEMGHLMSLTTDYNSRFGGYHYRTGTGVELDQSVYYISKSGKVTFYIGSTFTNADQTGLKLK